MSNDVKENLKSQSTWMRGLYMLIFAVFYTIAEILLYAIIVFQFLLMLFTAETNERLRRLGQGLSTYIYQILQFMNFNSEYQPYPFGAWPRGEPKAAKLVDQGNPENQ
jgi:sulfite exporter TauE/SafE